MRRRASLLAACCVLLLGGCGGGSGGRSSPRGTARGPGILDVWSSLPLRGPQATAGAAVLSGVRLALAQAHDRAGSFAVRLKSRDDSSAHGWSVARTIADAEQAATDPRTGLYIGELDSAASALSIPLLNEARVPQIGPGDGAVGLTNRVAGVTGAAEPARYYPEGRTFLRLGPSDAVQAAAAGQELRSAGCVRLAIAEGATADGPELAALLAAGRDIGSPPVVSLTRVTAATDARLLAARFRAAGADCLVLTGAASRTAVSLADDFHADLPASAVLGTDGVCKRAFVEPRDGGVDPGTAATVLCTSPLLPIDAEPGGRAFAAAYRSANGGRRPLPQALIGYTAMRLALQEIAALGSSAASRVALTRALFSLRDRDTPLGALGFDRYGNSTVRSVALYRPTASGTLAFVRVLVPSRVL